jgi:hypothetical protein
MTPPCACRSELFLVLVQAGQNSGEAGLVPGRGVCMDPPLLPCAVDEGVHAWKGGPGVFALPLRDKSAEFLNGRPHLADGHPVAKPPLLILPGSLQCRWMIGHNFLHLHKG